MCSRLGGLDLDERLRLVIVKSARRGGKRILKGVLEMISNRYRSKQCGLRTHRV